ncbi:MAG TPA: hypothetical protein DIW81_03885 [Planctomycetaceae bacterium]|nr:hypothetical protein [Rubinisphaera sp.]HCS50722.1 hypothetical protein [Planctomycetaceae bacterium]
MTKKTFGQKKAILRIYSIAVNWRQNLLKFFMTMKSTMKISEPQKFTAANCEMFQIPLSSRE